MQELTLKEMEQVNGGLIITVVRGIILLGGLLYSANAE